MAALVVASPASASVTLGETYGSSGGVPCADRTWIQAGSGSIPYAAPFDGVITSWSSAGFWSSMKLKVARLAGANSFTIVAEDVLRTDGVNGELRTYPVRIPVRQADVIGAYAPVGNCPYGGGAGAASLAVIGDVPPSSSPTSGTPGSHGIPISAVLERDADSDGYGDETQDACPTNASTQGPCPLPTTLGEVFAPFSNTCQGPFTVVVTASPGVVSAAPQDGVITSWSHQGGLAGTVSGSIRLKVFRPLGGADYLVTGQSEAQTALAQTLNTYPARVPIRQGERIGAGITNGQVSCGSGPAPTSSERGFVDADVAPGTSATFTVNSARVDISAVLEADADSDGYGDTSQDLCPTDASTQGACPAANPPPDTSACDAARAKLAKAKAKLKKLKRQDASAKKLKAAKKKAKKAKAAVKEAC